MRLQCLNSSSAQSLAIHLFLLALLIALNWTDRFLEIQSAPTLVQLIEKGLNQTPTRPPVPTRKATAPTANQAPSAPTTEAPSDSPPSTAAGLENGEKVFGNYEVTALPQLVREKRVPYPAAARSQGISGDVQAELVIGVNGKILQVRIVQSPSDLLSDAAREAFQSFEFKPAQLDGKPVAVMVRYRYRFVIEN